MVEVRTRGWASWWAEATTGSCHRLMPGPDAPSTPFLQKLLSCAEMQKCAKSESRGPGVPPTLCVQAALDSRSQPQPCTSFRQLKVEKKKLFLIYRWLWFEQGRGRGLCGSLVLL